MNKQPSSAARSGNKLGVPRSRLASNSASTPSTPGSKPINRSSSFNCSPITNAPSSSKANNPVDRNEPKLLKPLGPTLGGVEKKVSQEIDFESRPMEDKLLMMYMAAQQQHFVNTHLKKTENAVMKDADEQLASLVDMVMTKEKEVAELKSRTKLVKSYYEFMNVYNPLVEKIKKAKGIFLKAIPMLEELAKALDSRQHQISLVNINPVSPSDYVQITELLDKTAKNCKEIQLDQMKQITEAACLVSELSDKNSSEIKKLEEAQRLCSLVLLRLGQQITLADSSNIEEFMKLDDLKL